MQRRFFRDRLDFEGRSPGILSKVNPPQLSAAGCCERGLFAFMCSGSDISPASNFDSNQSFAGQLARRAANCISSIGLAAIARQARKL